MRSISSPNSSMRSAGLLVGRVDLDHVSPRTRNLPRPRFDVVAVVLHVDQAAQSLVRWSLAHLV
jgi:hypothetical protein